MSETANIVFPTLKSPNWDTFRMYNLRLAMLTVRLEEPAGNLHYRTNIKCRFTRASFAVENSLH
jgi:hypothetical protein